MKLRTSFCHVKHQPSSSKWGQECSGAIALLLRQHKFYLIVKCPKEALETTTQDKYNSYAMHRGVAECGLYKNILS
jgi:hypothetical protein